jgi:Mn2+/Fe2+ NRAMP family transporter
MNARSNETFTVSSLRSRDEGHGGRTTGAANVGIDEERGRLLAWPQTAPGLNDSEVPKAQGVVRRALGLLIPRLLAGVADADPALVVTAAVIGAAYGFSMLWAVALCIPILVSVFRVAARIGQETRQGLVDLLRRNYGKSIAIACAVVVITINLAMIIADLMAVTDALSMILGQGRSLFIALAAFGVWYILIFRDYKRVTRALVWLSLPIFAYVASAILIAPSPRSLMINTFVPRVLPNTDFALALIGLFGALLTPYLLVWQTSSRWERSGSGHPLRSNESHGSGWVTVILAYCIIVSTGAVLHVGHPGGINTHQVADVLRPAVGDLAPFVYALGIIGAGAVALPVLVASMCYSVAEALGWKYGLSEHPWDAKPFYVMISATMFVAAVANLVHINPVKALYWSQILAGILAVPILVFILLVSNDRRIMHTTNSRAQNFWIGAGAGALAVTCLLAMWWKIF